MSTERTHCSYPAEMRQDAKQRGLGLVTVHVRFPNGEQREYQIPAEPGECRFAAWAGALLFNRAIRPLPDLEELVRPLVEALPQLTEEPTCNASSDTGT